MYGIDRLPIREDWQYYLRGVPPTYAKGFPARNRPCEIGLICWSGHIPKCRERYSIIRTSSAFVLLALAPTPRRYIRENKEK